MIKSFKTFWKDLYKLNKDKLRQKSISKHRNEVGSAKRSQRNIEITDKEFHRDRIAPIIISVMENNKPVVFNQREL